MAVVVGEPIDDNWGQSRCRIQLVAQRFTPEALMGLTDFSHLDVVFVFDRLSEDEVATGARRPRGRADYPLASIFAQRGGNRANRRGVSICRIRPVSGLEVEGLDAIDGAPVLDLKPVLGGFLPRGAVRESLLAHNLMRDYW